jgi:phosphoribosylamine--glycine ligase
LRFLIYSKYGEGAGLGLRLEQEGNTVGLYIKEREYRTVYDGILDKVGIRDIDDETIIVFDSSGMGSEADKLKRSGHKVFGAGKFQDKLENDREFGLEFMQEHGIEIPASRKFESTSDGLDFIVDNRGDYIFKPSGDLPSKLTYKPCDPDDLAHYMEFVDKNYDIESFILQECIEGTALSTEFFCGKWGFVEPATHTIEIKKFMNDNLGPSTGCSANTIWEAERNDIVDKLKKIEDDILDQGYIGPIDLNVMVVDDQFYGLEWTPRFGLDAMPTWLQLTDEDVGQTISDLIDGSVGKISLRSGFASGVRVSIPPFPIEPHNLKVIEREQPNYGVPIRGFEDNESKVYLYEVLKSDGVLYHSAGTGAIGVVSDVADTIASSFNEPYRILEKAKIPDKQYRTDAAKVIGGMHKKVKEMVYA